MVFKRCTLHLTGLGCLIWHQTFHLTWEDWLSLNAVDKSLKMVTFSVQCIFIYTKKKNKKMVTFACLLLIFCFFFFLLWRIFCFFLWRKDFLLYNSTIWSKLCHGLPPSIYWLAMNNAIWSSSRRLGWTSGLFFNLLGWDLLNYWRNN